LFHTGTIADFYPYPEKQKTNSISWFSSPLAGQRIKVPAIGEAGILYETKNHNNRFFKKTNDPTKITFYQLTL